LSSSSVFFDILHFNKPGSSHSARDCLTQIAAILKSYFEADIVLGYELIQETGGVPRIPPVCVGERIDPDKASRALENTSHRYGLGKLIQLWEPYYEVNPKRWAIPKASQDSFMTFIECEQIKSFVFLPLHHSGRKLGAMLLNYRSNKPFSNDERREFEVCATLIGNHLAQIDGYTSSLWAQRSRMAIAHTLYDEVATKFKYQIEGLEREIMDVLNSNRVELPSTLASRMEAAKAIVFEIMRDLVVKSSGDLLIDLKNMSLYKALNTAAAALQRGWPAARQVRIDIHEVPPIIDDQPLEFRQLIYSLVLEVMGNSIKHGGPAPYISVVISWHNKHAILQIIDHGQGFNLQDKKFSERGLGFWSAYIAHLRGTFEVSSLPGYGTNVIAKIPAIPVRR